MNSWFWAASACGRQRMLLNNVFDPSRASMNSAAHALGISVKHDASQPNQLILRLCRRSM